MHSSIMATYVYWIFIQITKVRDFLKNKQKEQQIIFHAVKIHYKCFPCFLLYLTLISLRPSQAPVKKKN